MAVNAYEVLSTTYPALMPMLDDNFSVSAMLQAYFTYVAHLAAEECINVTGIKPKLSILDEKRREDGYLQAKLQIDFEINKDAEPRVLLEKKILWQRNLVIARAMEVNLNIREFARESVVALQSLAERYKVPWTEMRCGSKQIIVRRGGRRMELDIGQRQWLDDEEEGG